MTAAYRILLANRTQEHMKSVCIRDIESAGSSYHYLAISQLRPDEHVATSFEYIKPYFPAS